MKPVNIPDRWLQSRTQARKMEGFSDLEALKLAIGDWQEQERLAKELERADAFHGIMTDCRWEREHDQ